MGKDGVTTVSEAIHKIQLALLDGIHDENKLIAAGSLMCRGDYNDVVTERSISKLCGYPLCSNALPPEPPKKGHYRVSLKEHKVYDVQETFLYCGSKCLISSKAFAGSLSEERCAVLNVAKINRVLRLFGGLGVESDEDEDQDEKAEFVIKDKERVKGGEVNAEEWMGESSAIEGYVPQRDRRMKRSDKGSGPSSDKNVFQNEVDFEVAVKPNEKATGKKVGNKEKSVKFTPSESLEPLVSEINFTSTIITNDEYAVSKEKPNDSFKTGPSVAKEGKSASKLKKPVSKKGKDSLFGSMDFMSTIITEDEYSVSKSAQSHAIPNPEQVAQEFSEKLSLVDSEKKSENSKDSVRHEKNISQRSVKSGVNVSASAENQNPTLTDVSFQHSENFASSSSGYVKDESHAENGIDSSKAKAKSSLRTSGSKRIARSVSWADEKPSGVGNGNLCEFREGKDTEEPSTLTSKEMKDEEDSRRFASAEACALALSQAAEAVASGQFDVADAVSEAGITVLAQHEVAESDEYPVEDGALEERDTVKWPEKPDNLDSDVAEGADSNSSWFDPPPEGFSLALSPFAMMWNTLFSWMTSSSLAYIYGRDDSFHEEYMYINGREYPSKVVLPDGCSLEIKKTLAACLARALPGLIADLKLPTPLYTLEQGLACLLDTMSFMDALPPFRMKQWQVIVLLFIDALSVCRIPGLTPHLTSRRILIPKILSGAQISPEEYEIMKDMVIPLGRVPQFSMQSGG